MSTSPPHDQHVDNRHANISQQINVVGTVNIATNAKPEIPPEKPKKGRSFPLWLGIGSFVVMGSTLYAINPSGLMQRDDSVQQQQRSISSRDMPLEVSAALALVAPAVRACLRRDSKSRSRVSVRFSIDGSTGKVSAAALGEFTGTAVGKCVEAEIEKADFPRFDGKRKFEHAFELEDPSISP